MSDLTLTWDGVQYPVPERRIFALGEEVERIVTLVDIQGWAARPQLRRMARSYATMLRFAGARVSDDEVFRAIVSNAEDGAVVAEAMQALMVALMGDAPPAAAEADPPGETSAS